MKLTCRVHFNRPPLQVCFERPSVRGFETTCSPKVIQMESPQRGRRESNDFRGNGCMYLWALRRVKMKRKGDFGGND